MKPMEMRRRICRRRAEAEAVADEAPASLPPPAAPLLDTGALFAGVSEIIIAHGSEQYRLRLTRQNKLILTK
jgi:hemin uptake protein HemP